MKSLTAAAAITLAGMATATTALAADGKGTYDDACASCHAKGVAGSPKVGDKEAWSERVDKDTDTLYKHAIEGFEGDDGVMPAKGGYSNLSDDEVRAAVDYMVEESR
ncbi:c-type cytochrome [Thiohalospira sp.]|uniref:c-type cytochrome n=1 Tax=Thiohalospira sp. TaxID=3080549 RepID=UPI00397F8669